MAGKRQHDIPRFLLNGFASRTEGENSFVWCFRKDSQPFETNTLNIGLQKFFYGEPDADSLDALITNELEDKHAECVARVRKDRNLTSSSDEETLVEFVHSLALRTRNLRDILQKGVTAILNELYAVVSDADVARRQMLKEQEKNSPVWDKALTDYVRAKYGVQNRWLEKYLKWQENKDFKRWLTHGAEAHIQRQAALHKAQLTLLFDKLGEMARTSHNDALKKVFASSADDPAPRYNRYRELRWRVQRLHSASLILGDVAVLQFERHSGRFSAAFDGVKGDIILLPLSHDLLAVGVAEDTGKLPSPPSINRSSAELSLHFFVSSRNSEQEKDYQNLIGRSALRVPKIFNL